MNKSLPGRNTASSWLNSRGRGKKPASNQADLAKRVGETQSFVSKVERGERRLDFVELDSFCGAMGISLVDFTKRYVRAASAIRRRRD